MKIISSPLELYETVSSWKADGMSVGFVPTMGALHEGHLSLVDLAKSKAEKVVVSIFVNPTQFAPHEDFDSYPRDEDSDAQKLEARHVDLIYLPSTETMYPDGMETDIKAGPPAEGLETDFRPHFFDGVVNIVHRLFEQVQPDMAVFGKKDFQQLQVIKDMVTHLEMDIEIIGGNIVRDDHGLALSSRNAYLSDDELQIARRLNVILRDSAITDKTQALLEAGFDKVDYVSLKTEWGRILAAAWIGKTRLIDNVAV